MATDWLSKRDGFDHPKNKPAQLPINWKYWACLPEMKQWEACALSLNINPDNMKHHAQGWMAGPGAGPLFTDTSFPSVAVKHEFTRRLTMLTRFAKGNHSATVRPDWFAGWCVQIGLENLPPELLAMSKQKAEDASPDSMATANAANDVEAERAERAKRNHDRLAAAVTPQGIGYSGRRVYCTPPVDHPLEPCNFEKWCRRDAIPIEQACFVLLGFEPRELDILKFRQDPYEPRREPTWEAPPDYHDVLESLRVSIKLKKIAAFKITVYPYETTQVTLPDLVRWAKPKGYAVAPELESIIAEMGLEALETPAQDTAAPATVATQSLSPEPAGPLPLTTGDIAHCFDGLRWDEKGWKKPLGDKPNWLKACVAIPGQQGVSETRWNPVLIGAALVRDGHIKANRMRARFQTKPLFAPWLEAWKTYEADYLTTD